METVYIGYRSPLFNLAYRFVRNYSSAKDLLQDIFIKKYLLNTAQLCWADENRFAKR